MKLSLLSLESRVNTCYFLTTRFLYNPVLCAHAAERWVFVKIQFTRTTQI